LKEDADDLDAAISCNALAPGQAAAMPTFAEALDLHKAMVYSILWHFLRDRSLAEELAQEVFLELHRSWKAIQTPGHMTAWLRRVTTHRAIDAARKRKLRPETPLEESGEPTVLERVHDSFLSTYLERVIASLPPQQRMVIILRYQEDMDIQEIASVMNMKASTVKTQLARGLDLLRTKTSQRLQPGVDQ
jgi:RNA polymerase sigma-70 factor (ECF subfamily)